METEYYTPEIGDLAINENGDLGVITSKEVISFRQTGAFVQPKSLKTVYVGAYLNNNVTNRFAWESSNPKIVGKVDNVEDFVKEIIK